MKPMRKQTTIYKEEKEGEKEGWKRGERKENQWTKEENGKKEQESQKEKAGDPDYVLVSDQILQKYFVSFNEFPPFTVTFFYYK